MDQNYQPPMNTPNPNNRDLPSKPRRVVHITPDSVKTSNHQASDSGFFDANEVDWATIHSFKKYRRDNQVSSFIWKCLGGTILFMALSFTTWFLYIVVRGVIAAQ